MKITVVLKGEANDKDALQTAARMAAREGYALHVVLNHCSRLQFDRHLHFVLWDLQERLHLAAPTMTLEVPMDDIHMQVEELELAPVSA